MEANSSAGRDTPGLFRIPGQKTVVQGLYEHYVAQFDFAEKKMGRVWVTVGSPAVPIHISCSIHDVASSFKRFLWDIPGGILGSISLFKALREIEQMKVPEDQPWGDCYRSKARLSALAISSLRSTRRIAIVTAVFGLLALLQNDESPQSISDDITPSEQKPPELMSSKALAVVFAPTLLGGLTEMIEIRPSQGSKLPHKQTETPRRSFMHPFKTPKHAKTGSHDRTPDIEAGIQRNRSAVAIAEFLLKRWEDIVRQIQIYEARMNTFRSSRSVQELAPVDTESSMMRSQRGSLERVGMHYPSLRVLDPGFGRQSSESRGECAMACRDNETHLRPPEGSQNLPRSRSMSSPSPYEQEKSHQVLRTAEPSSSDHECGVANNKSGNSHVDRMRLDWQPQMLSSWFASNGPLSSPWWDQATTKPIPTPKRQQKSAETSNQRLLSSVPAKEWCTTGIHRRGVAVSQAVQEEETAKIVEEGTEVLCGPVQSTQQDHAVAARFPSPSALSFPLAFSTSPSQPPPLPSLPKIRRIESQNVPPSRKKTHTRSVSLNALDQPRDLSDLEVLAATSSDSRHASTNTNLIYRQYQLEEYSFPEQSAAPSKVFQSSSSAPPQRPRLTTHPAWRILKAHHHEQSRANPFDCDVSPDSSPMRMRVTPTRIPQLRQDVRRQMVQRRSCSGPRGGGTTPTNPDGGAIAQGPQLDESMNRGNITNRGLGPRELTLPNMHDSNSRCATERRHPQSELSLPSEPRFNRSTSFMNGQGRFPSPTMAPIPAYPGSSAAMRRTDQQQPIARRLVFRQPQSRNFHEQGVGQTHRDIQVSGRRDAIGNGEDAFWQHQNQNPEKQQQPQHRQGSYPRERVSTLFDEIERLRNDLNECNKENRRLRRQIQVMRAGSVRTREKENGWVFSE